MAEYDELDAVRRVLGIPSRYRKPPTDIPEYSDEGPGYPGGGSRGTGMFSKYPRTWRQFAEETVREYVPMEGETDAQRYEKVMKLLGPGAMAGVVKPKGGAWNPRASEFVARQLAKGFDIHQPPERLAHVAEDMPNMAAETEAVYGWARKAADRYLNKYAGTEEDPLRALLVPNPKRARDYTWENMTDDLIRRRVALEALQDVSFNRAQVGQLTPGEMQGLAKLEDVVRSGKVPAGDTVWDLARVPARPTGFNQQGGYPGRGAKIHAAHVLQDIGAYLHGNVPVQRLNEYDFTRAAREYLTSEPNLRRVEEAKGEARDYVRRRAIARAEGAERERLEALTAQQREAERVALMDKSKDKNLKMTEVLPIAHKFEDGSKWVEINKPGHFAHESDMMGHSVRGYEPTTPGSGFYGVGGWPAIEAGRAKVYSLRDSSGRARVTMEIDNSRPAWPEVRQIKGPYNREIPDESVDKLVAFLNSDTIAPIVRNNLGNVHLDAARSKVLNLIDVLDTERHPSWYNLVHATLGRHSFYNKATVDKLHKQWLKGRQAGSRWNDERDALDL